MISWNERIFQRLSRFNQAIENSEDDKGICFYPGGKLWKVVESSCIQTSPDSNKRAILTGKNVLRSCCRNLRIKTCTALRSWRSLQAWRALSIPMTCSMSAPGSKGLHKNSVLSVCSGRTQTAKPWTSMETDNSHLIWALTAVREQC